jgi:hypothetical protein
MVNNKINSNIKGIKTFRPKLTQVIFAYGLIFSFCLSMLDVELNYRVANI